MKGQSVENGLVQPGTPGPAGPNAVVLFFSMNRYISVGGAGRVCQQTFSHPVPAFVLRAAWKQQRRSMKN